jgi:hypothetical protein
MALAFIAVATTPGSGVRIVCLGGLRYNLGGLFIIVAITFGPGESAKTHH